MLKKYSQLFLSALIISDSLVILSSWIGAYYIRFHTSLEKRIEHDLYYIRNWSWFFDVKILIQTLWNGLINRHAY